ncbi:MAG: DUF3368 domain-containing protein [Anaerolineae bacterium]
MTVVSNTGPVIALAKVDTLPLLEQLFGVVLVPPTVHRELLAKPGPEARRLDQAFATFVQVMECPTATVTVEAAIAHLDHGEKEAVTLASLRDALLLIDDRLGRRAARHLGIRLTGTAGVLIQAVEQRLIPDAVAILEQMRADGYWLSDDVLIAVRRATEQREP